jgi:hypothetical protein
VQVAATRCSRGLRTLFCSIESGVDTPPPLLSIAAGDRGVRSVGIRTDTEHPPRWRCRSGHLWEGQEERVCTAPRSPAPHAAVGLSLVPMHRARSRLRLHRFGRADARGTILTGRGYGTVQSACVVSPSTSLTSPTSCQFPSRSALTRYVPAGNGPSRNRPPSSVWP